MVGYSGGSAAAEWAGELAASYAPELTIAGVAEGGIPVDLAHLTSYVSSADAQSDPTFTMVGLARDFGFDLNAYLTAYGRQHAAGAPGMCLADAASIPATQPVLLPQYQNVFAVPAFVDAFNRELEGQTPGNPTWPRFIGVGDSDGIGDGVMVTGDDIALAHDYCTKGEPVQLSVYVGQNHGAAATSFENDAFSFLEQRLAGLPATSECAVIPVGNPITPLPNP